MAVIFALWTFTFLIVPAVHFSNQHFWQIMNLKYDEFLYVYIYVHNVTSSFTSCYVLDHI